MTSIASKIKAAKIPDHPIVVAALYKFAPLRDLDGLRGILSKACDEAGVQGILLLATEGINGTIAGPREGIDRILAAIRAIPGLAELEHKESSAKTPPFLRMRVRIKQEIVTMGVGGIDPLAAVGTYVDPDDWNELISDPDVVVIDTRNDYEVRIGTFAGAIDPQIASFREFPDWLREHLKAGRKPKVAMFCTGGIRCEKSTAFLKDLGFDDVFHLRGGILKYLEQVPAERSLWRGECFVFDQRVAVGQGLALGTHELCFGCREPITAQDMASTKYERGVSCPHCSDALTPARRRRFQERQKQIEHAKAQDMTHLGPQRLKSTV